MSKVTDIYNRLVDVLVEMYPDKTRISYPYSLTDNNARIMFDGYGLKIGSSSFEPYEYCNFMNAREISVVFTREVVKVDSEFEPTDDIVKALMENVYEVQKKFFAYDELEIEAKIGRVEIGSVTAPEEVISGNSRFLSMEASFTFYIIEAL